VCPFSACCSTHAQARAFSTRDDVQDFLFANPDFMIGAVHFVFDGLSEAAEFDVGNGFEQFVPPGGAPPPPGVNAPPDFEFNQFPGSDPSIG